MNKIKTTILLAVILLLSAGTASAGVVSVSVVPIVDTVSPGGTATYQLILGGLLETETVSLSVPTPPAGLTYTFTPSDFVLEQTPAEMTVNLEVHVAADTAPGTYSTQGEAITAVCVAPDLCIQDEPITTYVVTTTAIPEFPTVALPIVSIIGLMLLFQKRKHN